MFEEVIGFIRSLYPGRDVVPLHEPVFGGREKEYVNAAIDSSYVSSIGKYVDRFEEMICNTTGAEYAVATVSGTASLHMALLLAGVKPGEEVVTQPLAFVATANAISYCRAEPVFIDIDKTTLGLSPDSLHEFLEANTTRSSDGCINKVTKRRISACVPVHTFGHPCRIDEISDLCLRHGIEVVEDAAESIGSTYRGMHTGTFGRLGVFSLNGNKTVTCGGGGVVVTNSRRTAETAKHLTTTAKIDHPYEHIHDAIGYNYRMPNLNAALACAQLEQLDHFVANKRELAHRYADYFNRAGICFFTEPDEASSNYWLNSIVLSDESSRDEFLIATNKAKVVTRPAWKLLNELAMYRHCQTDALINARWFSKRVVNIPSSVRT